MGPESVLWIAPNQPKTGNVTMFSELTDMTSSSLCSCR